MMCAVEVHCLKLTYTYGIDYPGGSNTVVLGPSTNGTANVTTQTTGITVTITNAETGGGLPHANNQPMIGCYYIMYIP